MHEEQLTRLRELFGFGGDGAALIPAGHHPFSRPPGDLPWYPIDSHCAWAYQKALYPNVPLEQVRDELPVNLRDSLVMFGSQVAHQDLRIILGDPRKDEEPRFNVRPGELGSGWQANLRWNLYCSKSMRETMPFHTLLPEYLKVWEEDERVILDAKDQTQYAAAASPSRHSDGEKVDNIVKDWLLVTVLPRYWDIPGQKIISFAGLYGPGTDATKLLFSHHDDELNRLQETIDGQPFYQALFKVSATTNDNNELVAQDVHFEQAAPLYKTENKGEGVILSAG